MKPPPQCIPAVLGFAVSFLLFAVGWNIRFIIDHLPLAFLRLIWMVPDSDFAVIWGPLAYQTVLTTLILLGGGLLTGRPKRSMLAPPGTPLDESSES